MSGYHKRYLDNFPMQTIKRVDRPTTIIHDDEVKRVDERDSGFLKAAVGGLWSGAPKGVQTLCSEASPFRCPRSDAAVPARDRGRDGGGAQGPLPEDPEALARHIKETAYFLRADAVGICKLPSYAVYTNSFPKGEPVECTHKYAIAILVDQDYRTSHATNGHDWISNAMSFVAYSASGFIACILADYIRRLGYPARAHHARNYQVVVPPILLWAGLGEMSRIGDCVLHPFMGPRFKAAVVTTDLPMAIDKPIDFGLQDFCSKCKKCARECPSGALTDGGKEMYNGYERWSTDIRKCTAMRVGNQHGSGCGTCIKVCPWNKPYTPFHRAIGWAMRHSGIARRLAIRGDDLMGYGKAHPEEQWWYDLEDINGVVQLPR